MNLVVINVIGQVELENLPLKKDALKSLGLPIEVRSGRYFKVYWFIEPIDLAWCLEFWQLSTLDKSTSLKVLMILDEPHSILLIR